MDESINARIPIAPYVARSLVERHGELVQGRNTRNSGKPSRPMIVNRDLGRYYELLNLAIQRIGPRFTEDEKLTILHVLASTHTNPWAIGALADEIRESVDDGSRAILADKLAALSPTEEFAIIDAIERWTLHRNRAVQIF